MIPEIDNRWRHDLIGRRDTGQRISVAMATFNGERFLVDQLNSIADQTRLPDEVVISDDCSSDCTTEIAQAFARRAPFDVIILRHQNRVGHANNFFRAMKACSGDLIALCDQDDVWHPEKLRRCEQPMQADPAISLVTHSARVVDEALRPRQGPNPPVIIDRKRRLPAGSLPPGAYDRYAGFTLMFRSLFLWSADVENRPGGFSGDGIAISHDDWTNLVCGALGALMLLPDQLVLYRWHGANASQPARSRLRADRGSPWVRRLQPSVALRTELESYGSRSNAARELGAYLESFRPLAHRLGCDAATGLQRSIDSHARYADAMGRRVSAYASRGVKARALSVGRHVLRGDYGARSRGGLGLPSLARDVTVGLARKIPEL
jgi:glycosyltransferase involved in cell wall biosynthesis